VILSQTAVYALKAVLCLASDEERRWRVDDIAERLDLPRNYLSKILGSLAREGVVTATRGRGGGFRLARPASQVMLFEVVGRFDPSPVDRGCLLGRAECSNREPCAAHGRWKGVLAVVEVMLRETSIADLAGNGVPAPSGINSA